MPRSQPSTVEKLTGDFLKLPHTEQTVVLGVFGAIVRAGARVVPEPVASAPVAAAETTAIPAVRKPRRRPYRRTRAAAAVTETPPALPADEGAGEPVDTE